jgi:hypothetical protein
MTNSRPRIAYILDPRFPGGTSSAVAAELRAIHDMGRITIHAISSKMFKGQDLSPPLAEATAELGLNVIWDAPEIAADTVIVHNPSFLRFQDTLECRILARHLILVTHENFLRPGEVEGFDVAKCLDLFDQSSLALRKSLAPISSWNRETLTKWARMHPQTRDWDVLEDDWFNICDFEIKAPTQTPRDRRGRHSRPGFEKFPGLEQMDLCFPPHAERNVILGADSYLSEGLTREGWQMHAFRSIDVSDYFDMIDFMIYFTAPTWRESFGRVLAEGIAAGKLVISDAQTAKIFGGAVLSATPAEVDGLVAGFIADPQSYTDHVTRAQETLAQFSPDAFRAFYATTIAQDFSEAA